MSELRDWGDEKFPPPREFQTQTIAALRKGFIEGKKNQLVCAPTASGKTLLSMAMIQNAVNRGKKAVFLCNREVLVEQTSRVADSLGMSYHGIIKAQHWRRDMTQPFQIASIQTIVKRGFFPEADLYIHDEAHLQFDAVTQYARKRKAWWIGLSATPFAKGLGGTYDGLVNVTTMHDLVQKGILAPMDVMTCVRPDMKGARVNAMGEWTAKDATDRGLEIVGDVVTEWVKHAAGKKTIVFAATIRHCEAIVKQFNDVGVMAALYTSETKQREREQLVEEFDKPDSFIRVLVSVAALSTGFDVKSVEVVVDCRPLRKSLSEAVQMWGRGMRHDPLNPEKRLLLLDHSGNIIRMAEDFEDFYFNGLALLDDAEKLDKKVRGEEEEEHEAKGCPKCGHTPFHKRCMACGYEIVKPALDEALPGEMMAFKIGKKVAASSNRNLWDQLVAYACAHSSPEKQRGRAWHLYRKITGMEPPRSFSFDVSRAAQPTNVTLNKIRSLNIAYVKGRQEGRP